MHFLCLLMIGAFSAMPDAAPVFEKAQPVWPKGQEEEMNLFVGFRAVVAKPEAAPVLLRVTASTLYRARVNGVFAGHGPARAAHGYYRVDEWDITPLLKAGENVVSLEVAGYNVNSYYLLDQPAFAQAEVVAGNTVLAATGNADLPFPGHIIRERIKKVQRYSFQRPFIEVYRMESTGEQWMKDAGTAPEAAACEVVKPKKLLVRRVARPEFPLTESCTLVASGTVARGPEKEKAWKDRSLTHISEQLKGYPENELELVLSTELQQYENASLKERGESLKKDASFALEENGFLIFDLGKDLSGFPLFTVSCKEPVRLVLAFDEMLQNGDVNWMRLGCTSAVQWELAPGEYALETFEPYTMRYLKCMVLKGSCAVTAPALRHYENPDTRRAVFEAADGRLNTLFEAGRNTFVQNAVDIFMDCPHRERAGWLCDSFFTARSAMALSGNTRVEKNFIENFSLPESFRGLPKGMLPMCYPSDHYDGVYIPNWSLWLVVELGEYAQRSGDKALVDAMQERVMNLFAFFKGFENSDGLLEKLQSWVFVEWSAANGFVQDVNYPSNMLYAAALDTAAKLYDMPALAEKAAALREAVRKQSFDGEFFVDNALRKENGLEATRNRTEVCQYFAFYFGVATPESHPELWRRLLTDFGPKRKESGAWKEIHAANAFVGNMLRLELLSRTGHCRQLLNESIDYLLYMADRTGTLWENVGDNASLNHGFASHIVHTLYRDVLGLYQVEVPGKKLVIRFADVDLPWCRGKLPVGDAVIGLSWKKEGGVLEYRLDLPEGWTAEVVNQSGCELKKMD